MRLALYLLRLALGAHRWLHRWETRLTLILWLLLGFSLLGWFDFIESSLDAIDLAPGKARFTVWQLLKGVVVVTMFVVATSLVSRAIEARVMKLARAGHVHAHRHQQVLLRLPAGAWA